MDTNPRGRTNRVAKLRVRGLRGERLAELVGQFYVPAAGVSLVRSTKEEQASLTIADCPRARGCCAGLRKPLRRIRSSSCSRVVGREL